MVSIKSYQYIFPALAFPRLSSAAYSCHVVDIYICFPGFFLCCSWEGGGGGRWGGGHGKYNKPKPKQLSHLEESKCAGCSLISSTWQEAQSHCSAFLPAPQCLCCHGWANGWDALSPHDSVPFALLPLENTEAFAVLSPCGCWQFRGKKANSVA